MLMYYEQNSDKNAEINNVYFIGKYISTSKLIKQHKQKIHIITLQIFGQRNQQ